MVNRHDVDKLARDALGILLLDELGEDALEICECERGFELRGRRVCQDFAFGNDDDTVADQLDDFEDVRDVEDCLALSCELLQEVFEESGGDYVEAGERLVEDEELGIVQQSGRDENALLHALGVKGDRRITPGLEAKERKESIGFEVDKGLGHVAQASD